VTYNSLPAARGQALVWCYRTKQSQGIEGRDSGAGPGASEG
jgi:hypothetical protein